MPFDPNRKIRMRPSLAGLPDLNPVTPPFVPPAPAGIPGGVAPPSTINPRQTRSQEIDEARAAYGQKRPGRFKSGLMSALQGLATGLSTGGGLGAGLGGAIAGGAFGAINPRGAREMEFNQRIKPRMLERFADEDQTRAQQAAEANAQQQAQFNQARIRNLDAETEARNRPPKPSFIETPAGVFDPESRSIIPNTAPPPKEPAKTAPAPRLGRNLRTGKIGYYNANDPTENSQHIPYQMPRQPRATGPAKAKKEPQYVSIDKVRQFAEKQGISVSEAKARAKQDGFTVVQ